MRIWKTLTPWRIVSRTRYEALLDQLARTKELVGVLERRATLAALNAHYAAGAAQLANERARKINRKGAKAQRN